MHDYNLWNRLIEYGFYLYWIIEKVRVKFKMNYGDHKLPMRAISFTKTCRYNKSYLIKIDTKIEEQLEITSLITAPLLIFWVFFLPYFFYKSRRGIFGAILNSKRCVIFETRTFKFRVFEKVNKVPRCSQK